MADEVGLKEAYYLTGATASGKTAVGIELAKLLDAEVVALDSMTLYRGMNIGTAKPTVEDRAGVPHHLLDVLDPWEEASVADYRRMALDTVAAIRARGRAVLFVGGTPLYLKVLMRGLFEGPGANPELRAALEAQADREGPDELHARLQRVDPASAARLHPHDRRRVIRALEVFETTGSTLTELQTEHAAIAEGWKVVALERDRLDLHKRIAVRVEQMFTKGLISEVEALLADRRGMSRVAAQAVGYSEVAHFLQGLSTLEHVKQRIVERTRQFAKRQDTWFRGLGEVRMIGISAEESISGVAQRVIREFGVL